MNKKQSLTTAVALALLAVTATFTSCTKDGGDEGSSIYEFPDGSYEGYAAKDAMPDGTGSNPGEGDGNTEAGVVTAGEWSDLQHWPFWSALMAGDTYGDKSDYWQIYTNNRVAVQLTDAKGSAVAGAKVTLQRNGTDVWQAVSDNHGLAELWVGLTQRETANAETLTVTVDGRAMEGHPELCPWDSLGQAPLNRYTCAAPEGIRRRADIAFVVDATGSMSDEISFLKSDLVDIIGKAQAVHPDVTMRTAALFYRDEGDDYLTRHSDFTTTLSATARFVDEQHAGGGGDYPEAVHTALSDMLQNLSWDTTARTRIAFLILDAPAHHKTDVIASLQQSVAHCARLGIRLIPVAASGVDKNTEFMLRFFAVSTGGTYVFLTNDSGVGLDHIQATVGDYEVELLNSLIIRLIDYYTE